MRFVNECTKKKANRLMKIAYDTHDCVNYSLPNQNIIPMDCNIPFRQIQTNK